VQGLLHSDISTLVAHSNLLQSHGGGLKDRRHSYPKSLVGNPQLRSVHNIAQNPSKISHFRRKIVLFSGKMTFDKIRNIVPRRCRLQPISSAYSVVAKRLQFHPQKAIPSPQFAERQPTNTLRVLSREFETSLWVCSRPTPESWQRLRQKSLRCARQLFSKVNTVTYDDLMTIHHSLLSGVDVPRAQNVHGLHPREPP